MTHPRRSLRRFRRLLRLYPRPYRERYGPEMEEVFLRELREGGGGAVFWLRVGVDHARAAFAVRRRGGEGGRMTGFWNEVLVTLRGLRRAPAFTAFSIGTLALGVAAAATAFTVLDSVVLSPLPYPDSERLFVVGSDFAHDPGGLGPLSVDQIVDLMDAPAPAEIVTGVTSDRSTVTGLGDPERLGVNRVAEGFFELLGAAPAVGRLLGDADQRAGAARTAVVDHGFWEERFGGDAGVVGRLLQLDGEPHEIVGVLTRDFIAPEGVAGDGPIWTAARFREGRTSSGSFSITGLAKLPSRDVAQAFEAGVDERFVRVHDFLRGGTVVAQKEHVVGELSGRVRSAVAGVILLLMIACVNVSSLMLTRARARARELSVRAALGAGGGRIARPLLIEAVALALGGGAGGGTLTVWAIYLFRSYAPPGMPRLAELGVDRSGLIAVVVISLAAMLAASAVPALSAVRRARGERPGSTRSATVGRRDARVRGGLVTLETALAVVLVVASGLLANDLVRLTNEDRVFRPVGLTTMRVDLVGPSAPEEPSVFWSDLVESARGLPGVLGAELTSQLPYDGVSTMRSLEPEGSEGEEAFVVSVSVSPGYFDLLSIPILEGRTLLSEEHRTGAPVVLVNHAFVRSFWPDGRPLGRTIVRDRGMDDPGIAYTVVGVADDLRTRPGDSAPPQVFFGWRAVPARGMELVVRTANEAEVAAPLRALIRSVEPELPVGRIDRVDAIAAGTLDRPRFYAGLFGGFATLALLLALVGVYGTTAYATRSRTREIGIRIALGAMRREVVGEVLASTGRVVAIGIVCGLLVASALSGALTDVLWYVTPRDALTYVAVGIGVLATGILAAAQPAVRSTRVDPATTLRGE